MSSFLPRLVAVDAFSRTAARNCAIRAFVTTYASGLEHAVILFSIRDFLYLNVSLSPLWFPSWPSLFGLGLTGAF